MQVIINAKDSVMQRENSEYAAWYTNWKLLAGAYALALAPNGRYVATCNAEITDDYYASHFGGVAVGTYDTRKNAGKRGTRSLSFSASELLQHGAVTFDTDAEYDAVLQAACQELLDRADILKRCIASASLDWTSGHASELARVASLYAEIQGVIGRRDYNRKNAGTSSQWAASETVVKAINGFSTAP